MLPQELAQLGHHVDFAFKTFQVDCLLEWPSGVIARYRQGLELKNLNSAA